MAVKRKAPTKKSYKTKGASKKKVTMAPAPAKKVPKVSHPYSNQYHSSSKGREVTVLQRPYTNQHGSRR